MCPGEETVAAYVAGRLARDERDHFEGHLDTCSACHELLAALGKARAHREPLATPTELGIGSTSFDDGDATSWAAGDQLGRYVLLARLGEGGMGVVYAAYDPELDRKVALKLVRHAGEAARERLRDEARAIAKLAHPNVVAVHDVGDAGGDVFVAMEHVDGATLTDWLRGQRTQREVLDVFLETGRGLAAAHAAGLVHRDVKPSNLIVGRDGRARVLDFGLARARAGDDGVVGTPAYMPPEQQRGERVDARADQFAFCVALWEALAGKRPTAGEQGAPPGVSERVARALRRGLASRADERFPALSDLLAELAPPPPRRRWLVIAPIAAAIAIPIAILLVRDRKAEQETCAVAGAAIDHAWGADMKQAVRAAFAATKLPYAPGVADRAIGELDAWTARWKTGAEATCRATLIDRVQPAELHAVRRGCLDDLQARFVETLHQLAASEAAVVANAGALVAALPAPERCDAVTMLVAPPGEASRTEIDTLRATITRLEAELVAGRIDRTRPDIEAIAKRAGELGYLPLVARARYLIARLAAATGQMDAAIAALHAAAHAATAARDLPQLAEIWIELALVLGNDVATLDAAAVFDGYAAALVEQLPDRDVLALRLEFARCNRNLSHTRPDDAKRIAQHCRTTIERAAKVRPAVANAARARLGHFQRLLGDPDGARATLSEAVTEATKLHGPHHPDVAVARNAFGLALISEDKLDQGIAELRQALAIRRAAYPGANLYVAESLAALADAVSVAGDQTEALKLLDEALAMLAALGKSDSLIAVNAHILSGMSLEEQKRLADATRHYLLAADVVDRALPNREALAVLALTLTAEIAVREGRTAAAIEHLERALRLHDRGKSTPAARAKTQLRLAELLRPTNPARAKALADAAAR